MAQEERQSLKKLEAKTEAVEHLALLAGSGQLPIEIFNGLKKQQNMPFLILLKGNAPDFLYQFPHEEIDIVAFTKLIKILKQRKIKKLILAGGVKARPQLRHLRFDFATLLALPRLFFALKRGDDALLKAFIKMLESYGIKVIAAQDVLPHLAAPLPALLTSASPSKGEQKNIEIAVKAAKLLGWLDIGQGAVAVDGRVIALEGPEGTDEMLKRVEKMRKEKKIPPLGGVLVKCAKPGQELRVDLPTIGKQTIENIIHAKLAGVAIEAQHSFIVEKEKVLQLANEKNIFIKSIALEEYDDLKTHEK